MPTTYLNHLGNNEFLKYFYIKLYLKINSIFKLSYYINNNITTFELNEPIISHYVSLNTLKTNTLYLEENLDYIKGETNFIFTKTALLKLFYTLISETIEALSLFENSLNSELELKPLFELIEFLFLSLNEISLSSGKNTENLEKVLLILERIKNDI